MAEDRLAELAAEIVRAEAFAHAIYVDALTDIDGEALARTHDRYMKIYEKFGSVTVFGILMNWVYTYAELVRVEAVKREVEIISPKITLNTNPANDFDVAHNMTLQFFNFAWNNDLEMAYDIMIAAQAALPSGEYLFLTALKFLVSFDGEVDFKLIKRER